MKYEATISKKGGQKLGTSGCITSGIPALAPAGNSLKTLTPVLYTCVSTFYQSKLEKGRMIPGLHNMADHRTIGRRKLFRLAEK